jgi:predicted enzyme related to lactoylglutathione lyase
LAPTDLPFYATPSEAGIPPHWDRSPRLDDHHANAMAVQHGGAMLYARMAPGGRSLHLTADPTGGVFALIQPTAA